MQGRRRGKVDLKAWQRKPGWECEESASKKVDGDEGCKKSDRQAVRMMIYGTGPIQQLLVIR